METRYDALVASLREAAQPDRVPPPELEPYVQNIRLHAYKVTDREVEELTAAGFSEDELFEHTVSTAVAAGLDRLDAAMRALG